MTAASSAPVPAPLPPSMPPGNGPTPSAACSAPSAPTWACAAATLWQDYPAPLRTHPEKHKNLDLLLNGEDWRALSDGSLQADQLAVNAHGEGFFSPPEAQAIFRVGENGRAEQALALSFRPGGISFHPGGELYVADPTGGRLLAFDPKGNARTVLSGIKAQALALSDKGVYFSGPQRCKIRRFRFRHALPDLRWKGICPKNQGSGRTFLASGSQAAEAGAVIFSTPAHSPKTHSPWDSWDCRRRGGRRRSARCGTWRRRGGR